MELPFDESAFEDVHLVSVEAWSVSQMVSVNEHGVTNSVVVLFRTDEQTDDDPPLAFVFSPRGGLRFGADVVLVAANE